MPTTLEDLRGLHSGATVFVLGSSAFLDYLDFSFFDDKICVSSGPLRLRDGFKPDYSFTNHWEEIRDLVGQCPDTTFVANEREWPSLQPWEGAVPSNLILNIPTSWKNEQSRFDPFRSPSPTGKSLIFGSSKIHGAMHLAAHLGAKYIVLVGVDNSRLDGRWNIAGYPATPGGYPVDRLEQHLRLMKKWLETHYQCEVYSLNPFVNCHLEGHSLSDWRVGNSSVLHLYRFIKRSVLRQLHRTGQRGV